MRDSRRRVGQSRRRGCRGLCESTSGATCEQTEEGAVCKVRGLHSIHKATLFRRSEKASVSAA
jgi:hypothetical protein